MEEMDQETRALKGMRPNVLSAAEVQLAFSYEGTRRGNRRLQLKLGGSAPVL